MEEAKKLYKTGHPDDMADAINLENAAEDLLDLLIPPVKVEQPLKVAGTRVVKYWKFKITDVIKIPREYLIPDEKRIARVVRAMKDKTNIPGVEVWSETQNQVTGK
jgi:hypothetical protein